MGIFTARCRIENPVDRSRSAIVSDLLVDTGSELTWVPASILSRIGIRRENKIRTFALANGQLVTRAVGFAILRVGESFTNDEVVFAESGDTALLGARSLEGLNLSVDPPTRRLIPSGPTLAATPTTPRPARRRAGQRRTPRAPVTR
jgi:predicted aspartyl protease